MAETTMRMKLLIDTNGKRILFAEAGKDCVDFLSLPLTTLIFMLRTRGMVGSLPNLYKSLESLHDTYIKPHQNKDFLLKPVSSSSSPLLPIKGVEAAGKTLYQCSQRCRYVADDPSFVCPACCRKMRSEVSYVGPRGVEAAEGGGGIVKELVTYTVMDDLTVTPMSAISSLTMLNRFNVKDLGALEEKVVSFGMNEAVKLLKASLVSNKVLTEVFCH